MASLVVFGGSRARAQAWNDSTADALVTRAIAYRARQLGDSGLTDYHATARGYLTFLAQVGPGYPDAPRILKSDQLAVEVYWHAPNLSKEIVVGHRDTLLFPANIEYYTDRYGIIQSNFPDSIRMGDGNDVRGVPHPLSPDGRDLYDFEIVDSLRLRTPDRSIDVYVAHVRPRDESAPRVVGSIYLERTTGALVRLAFTFTRSAILDKRIERLSVTLENALIEGRFWLPRRQELEVVRSTTWLDYPVRGIIRGHWDACCYEVNRGIPLTRFVGAPIVSAPRRTLERYPWHGRVLDSIPPDVRVATSEDVRNVQETAQRLVRAAALRRASSTALSARGISDFARINRVEGLALGAGVTETLAPAWTTSLRARYGVSDRALKGDAAVTWHPFPNLGVSAHAFRSYRDVGDVQETSTLVNSLASELAGADRTDPYYARGGGLSVGFGDADDLRWHAGVERAAEGALSVHAEPAFGHYGATVPAWAIWDTRATAGADGPLVQGPLGTEWRASTEIQGIWFHRRDSVLFERQPLTGRFSGNVEVARATQPSRIVARTTVAVVASRGGSNATPPQDLVFLGGPTSAPGYGYHEFVGRLGASEHIEWRIPVPAPAIRLDGYGSTPHAATLIPFAHVAYLDHSAPFAPPRQGWYPALGLGLSGIFDLIRLDLARGLRDGRWTFDIDVAREFWGVL